MAPPAASLRVAGPHPCPFSPAAPLMIQFHPANWQIPFASTHPCAGPGRQPQRSPATAGAGHLPGPRRERRPASRPCPTGPPDPRRLPSCVQTLRCPKVIRGGVVEAHRIPTAVLRGQLASPLQKEEGPRLGACAPSRCPLQPPGAAGLVSGGVVTQI
ncbi:hypothetical protein BO94DRAFT_480640 [Aspergillus sclerotioniger CBS 115572]|uniref:Uncharacterized protein n=1 Tax=Aspergillus sclerotioniger CBS 115572 TaxID=1450535 RepID=A0A317UQL5_9EURO|nr:hypothetical protein BO94DRAFT_480640 [Aspergillus sclerotioniger CBS 115572]PWY63865.1 hypothetical protein BO94DRAFT_480640 [Aspergillus sclerotioniger CBS 115572]